MAKTICYWRGSAEVREDIVRSLREDGSQILFVRGLEEVLDCLLGDDIDAIIVDGSAGQREASDRVIEITNTEILHTFPILFLSNQASKRVSVLKAKIRQLFPIDLPYRPQSIVLGFAQLFNSKDDFDYDTILAIFNSIQAVAGSEILQSEQAMPILAEKEASAASPVGSLETEIQASPGESTASVAKPVTSLKSGQRKSVESNSVKNRERLRSNLNPLKLKDTYGGEVLSIATHTTDFDDALLFPERKAKADFRDAFKAYEETDNWAGVHSRRVAFVATALANALAFDTEQERNVRLTCLFINMSHTDGSSPHLRRQDFLRCESLAVLLEIAKAFRESAGMIRSQFGEERSAQTVELIAEMLSGKNIVSPDQEGLKAEAECVLIVELADRSCWGEGHWNPFGAYQVMRHLRSKGALISNIAIKNGMARILGEAVTAHVTVGNVFMSNDDLETQTVLREKPDVRRAKDGSMRKSESRRIRSLHVQLADLEPGMRLAEPLKARDGKLVLGSDVLLDQELVHQVWQLAAVRALHSKIAVQVEL